MNSRALAFIWKNSKVQLLIVAGLFVIGIGVFLRLGRPFPHQWENWLEPYLALCLMLVASFIWYNEKKQDWEMSLPKRLTVHFKHEGKYVLSCYHAYLAGEADIRAWSQQIGFQMAGGQQLAFYPFIVEEKPEVSPNKDCKLYVATFFLKDISKIASLAAGRYVIWYPSDSGHDTKEYTMESRPSDAPTLDWIRHQAEEKDSNT